jgi:hypothetical protein
MESNKRLYLGLLLLSLVLVIALIPIIGILFKQDTLFSKVILTGIVSVLGLLFILLGLGILAIVIMIIRSKTIPSLENITKLVNEMLFPLTLIIGKLLGIKTEKIRSSYIAVNNNLVKSKKLFLNGNRVMILLPHCLQDADCPHKITMDINNCQHCGKCCINDLIEIGKKYSAIIKVATGGTLARKLIEDIRPTGVIAVACERDLSMGIQECGALPVYGVLNCRPNGPCYNTSVDIDKVEQALVMICKGG